jgi:hypothetical protein
MSQEPTASADEDRKVTESQIITKRVRWICDVDVQIDKSKVDDVNRPLLENLFQRQDLFDLWLAEATFFELVSQAENYLSPHAESDLDVQLNSTDIVMAVALSADSESARRFLAADARRMASEFFDDVSYAATSKSARPAQALIEGRKVPSSSSHLLKRIRKRRYMILDAGAGGMIVVHAVFDKEFFSRFAGDWTDPQSPRGDRVEYPIDKLGEVLSRTDEAMQDAAENHITVNHLEVAIWSQDEITIQSAAKRLVRHGKENYPEIAWEVYYVKSDGEQEEVPISS